MSVRVAVTVAVAVTVVVGAAAGPGDLLFSSLLLVGLLLVVGGLFQLLGLLLAGSGPANKLLDQVQDSEASQLEQEGLAGSPCCCQWKQARFCCWWLADRRPA